MDITSDDILGLCASAESVSTHPIAQAVVDYAKKSGVQYSLPTQSENFVGKGIKCVVDGKSVIVGKELFMRENGIDISKFLAKANQMLSEGKTVTFVAEEGVLLGLIAVADKLKDTSEQTFKLLKSMAVKRILLSGDNKICAESIAKTLDADEVYSEVMPEQKAEIISSLKQKYGTVMMVGDGINDAVALTEATVGCAIGAGSDIAIESADLVLRQSEPLGVVKAIKLSKSTMRVIKQNLFWAFCYNLICIPIAAGVFSSLGLVLNPMIGGLAMSLSSVCVVTNALRLRGKKL